MLVWPRTAGQMGQTVWRRSRPESGAFMVLQDRQVGARVDELETGRESSSAGAQRLILLSIAVSLGIGFLGGLLIGKRKGEARGLMLGIEIGRTEAVAATSAPRPWRRLWRRGVETQVP